MSLRVERVDATDPQAGTAWNDFVERSNEGTLFHRLDFLAYHGERFSEAVHHLAFRRSDELFAVMPMAIFEENGERVARSPYGGSVGGPCCARTLRYHEADELIVSLCETLTELGVDRLELVLPLREGHLDYSDTFRFALEQRGAVRGHGVPCSLLDLRDPEPIEKRVSSRARRMWKKARSSEVRCELQGDVDAFWHVMELTFARHGARPTHSHAEFRWLHESFPDRIWANVAYHEDRPVAGIGCFQINDRMLAAFYLCSDPEARQTQPLTALVMESLEAAQAAGTGRFDFGTTGRARGFEFKENFGTRTSMRERFSLSLAELRSGPADGLYEAVEAERRS